MLNKITTPDKLQTKKMINTLLSETWYQKVIPKELKEIKFDKGSYD